MSHEVKVFRDPVYGLISFDKGKSKPLLDLIDCAEIQRLKRIRQLGFSYFTFPSATHDRFSHSLGMAYLVGLILDKLELDKTVNVPVDDAKSVGLSRDEFKLLMQMVALLHDVGHGPFSHAFEQATNIKHEKITADIIANEKTQVNKILREIPEALGKHAVDWILEIISGVFPLYWARDLISSQVDADRMDYLLRDAYMCGVNYVSFDRQWLINNMTLHRIPQEDNRMGLVINAQKGVNALEAFIISRYQMYEQVYFHKTTRGIEQLVVRIFKRVKQLLSKGQDVPFIDNRVQKILAGEFDISAFLFLDDFVIVTQIQLWQQIADQILQTLCQAFINRRPYKMFKEGRDGNVMNQEFYRNMDQIFGNKDKADAYYYEDNYINNPYKDEYLLGKSRPEDAGHIWLLQADGNIRELSAESQIIG